MSQLMDMAGLPSDQVTMVAVVRESGSVPGVLLASAQATARLAMPSTNVQRIVDRAIMLLPRRDVATLHRADQRV
jgi:hypothetical protein